MKCEVLGRQAIKVRPSSRDLLVKSYEASKRITA